MRRMQLALGIIMLAGLAGIAPARADYPWCIQDSEYGYPGDCSYQTLAQCQFSVSGRKGYCAQNPAALMTRPPLQPLPRGRRHPPF